MSQTSSFWIRHAASVFALRTFSAAMLAFSIALLLDMPRPYWAMTSVYVTSNLFTGATTSKAVYRILGTLIGAIATIALVPNLVNSPELLSLAIALWVGFCLYLSLIDGTPRSYLFMLSGYTVALLGFPIIATPQAAFEIVVARVQEITLGICCASVVGMLVLPRSVASTVIAQTDAWIVGARKLAINVLAGRGDERERDKERLRLAAAASEIDQLRCHLAYETNISENASRGLLLLRQQMLSLLPLLGSIEDRQLSLGPNQQFSAAVAATNTKIAAWLEGGGRDQDEASALCTSIDEIRPTLNADSDWTDITISGLTMRLRNFVDVMRDCQLLRDAIASDRNPDHLPLSLSSDAPVATAPHKDHLSTLLTAVSIAVAVLGCSLFSIATGWSDGVAAPLFAAVVGSILAGADDPLPTFRNFYLVFIVVIVVHGVYVFGVLPRITTLEMLIVALSPTFLLFCWMAARPATGRVGGILAIFVSVQLSLTDTYSADFLSYANSSLALMLGIALTGVLCAIVRLAGAEWIAGRLLRSNRRTLAAVAGRNSEETSFALAGLMQHRLALLAARVAVVPADARSDAVNLRQLRTALNILAVRRASSGSSHRLRTTIEAFFSRAAAICSQAGPLPDALVEQLDSAIALTLQDSPGEPRDGVLLGLTGIRAGLFPQSPAYQPQAIEPGIAGA